MVLVQQGAPAAKRFQGQGRRLTRLKESRRWRGNPSALFNTSDAQPGLPATLPVHQLLPQVVRLLLLGAHLHGGVDVRLAPALGEGQGSGRCRGVAESHLRKYFLEMMFLELVDYELVLVPSALVCVLGQGLARVVALAVGLSSTREAMVAMVEVEVETETEEMVPTRGLETRTSGIGPTLEMLECSPVK